jgi:hypothetical protein
VPGKPDEKQSAESRWLARLPVLAAIAGIPVAIVSGRPLSSLILIALASISLPFAIQQLRKLKNRPSFTHPTLMAALSAAIVPVVVLTAILVPQTRNYVLHDILGFAPPSKPEVVQIEQGHTRPEVAGGTGYASFLVTLSNPGDRERLVKHLSISASRDPNRDAACSSNLHVMYVVGAKIGVSASHSSSASKDLEFGSDVESFSVDQSGKELSDPFVRGASGRISVETCYGTSSIDLQFDVSLPLAPKETTTFEIRFPQTFVVSKVLSEDAKIATLGEKIPIFSNVWPSHYAWPSSRLEMTLDNGQLLTVCRDWRPDRSNDLNRC